MVMSRRKFIRTLGGTGIMLAAGTVGLQQCDRMPGEAIAAWNGPNAASEGDIRVWALSWALLAPNPHNIQPWIADLTVPGEITLNVDPNRLLPETDPYGRQILIGHGTFLELLDIAAREKGFRLDITYFPDGEAPADAPASEISRYPVARIAVTKDNSVRPDPLFQAIPTRRSTKEPYDPARPLQNNHASALVTAVRKEHSRLDLALDEISAAPLRVLTGQATMLEMNTPAKLEESIDLSRIGADEIAKHRDGIDLHGPMFWWLKALGFMTKEAAMTPGTAAHQGGMDYAMGWANASPSFGWISTQGNSRIDQVKAGRDYIRIDLTASANGFAIHPVSQLLQEYTEMAELQKAFYKAISKPEGDTVQMLFRLGYAERVPPSPRRDLESLLVTQRSACNLPSVV